MASDASTYVGLSRRQAVKRAKKERRNYRVLGIYDAVSAEGFPGRLTLWVDKGVVVATDQE